MVAPRPAAVPLTAAMTGASQLTMACTKTERKQPAGGGARAAAMEEAN